MKIYTITINDITTVYLSKKEMRHEVNLLRSDYDYIKDYFKLCIFEVSNEVKAGDYSLVPKEWKLLKVIN